MKFNKQKEWWKLICIWYTYLTPAADFVVQIQTSPFRWKSSELGGGKQGRGWMADWAAQGNFKAKYLLDIFSARTPCFPIS